MVSAHRGFRTLAAAEQLAMPRRAEPRVLVPADRLVSADRKPVFIRWRRRAAGSCWVARRWHYSIQNVKSRCCCVLAIAYALCRRRRGMLKFIRAGMYTSVQDGGREGQRQWDQPLRRAG